MNTSLYGGIIEISPDGQPITPALVLSNRGGTKEGVIYNVVNFVVANHLNNADEISFDVYKEIDGIECELWDSVKDFKLIYIPHFETDKYNPWYELQVTVDEEDGTIKHCEGVHLQEAELSQLTLNNIEINTEDDIARDDYVVTVIYNSSNKEGSLLDRILKDKAAHYDIYHVDSVIARMQRTFSWDGVSIKDALDDIATEVEGIFVYGEYTASDGKIHRTISLYDLNDVCLDCGERGTFTNKVCTACGSTDINYGYGEDSGLFLSHENFADSISYSSNKDNVKNCFRLVAGDDLMTATVRNINPSGSQYIWYLSDEVRSEMSDDLQTKLKAYDTEYEAYKSTKSLNISSTTVSIYNALVSKYKSYDSSLETVSYPIVGCTALTDFYYQALSLYTLLQTTLVPASSTSESTSASQEIKKLTSSALSPIGIQNATSASATTVNLSIVNYAKVYVNTALYTISATTISYASQIWKGTITLTAYADDTDTATTSLLTVTVSETTADYIETQIKKTMKKDDDDAIDTIDLFEMSETAFRLQLSKYSVDNLSILSSVARACLDVMIEEGIADTSVDGYADLYTSLYKPYYNKNKWIENELCEREAEVAKLRGSKTTYTKVYDTESYTISYYGYGSPDESGQFDSTTPTAGEYYVDQTTGEMYIYTGNAWFWCKKLSLKSMTPTTDGVLDLIEEERQSIADALDLQTYLGETLWIEFCSFRRDDEFKNENYISDGLSDAELIEMAKEFVEKAEREIVKSATLQHTISCNLNDLLLTESTNTKESDTDISLIDFDIGNWIHIEIDGNLYRLRLTDYQINYSDLETIDVEFSDVTYGIGGMSDVQSVLSLASSMTTSYPSTVRQANKGNQANQLILDMVENGLALTNKKIINTAENQNMVVDESGLLMRSLNDFGDEYSDNQVKLINNGIYYTNDNWETVKAGLGKFIYYDPEELEYKEGYGLIAETIVGNIILGNEVGIYNTSGSVKIDEDGLTITSYSTDVNPSLFTLQRENEDGTYTKYIYVNDDGEIEINASEIKMTVEGSTESLTEYIGSSITQTETDILATVSKAQSKYDTGTQTINYYGYGTPSDNEQFTTTTPTSGEYYLDQNTGILYKYNGTSWSYCTTYELITANLASSIEQTETDILLEVSETYSTKDELENAKSSIQLTTDSISAEVTAIKDYARCYYGTCSTGANTVAKVVSCSDSSFALKAGATIQVKFTYKNTAGTPTLNVNGTGAKSIHAYGAALSSSSEYNWAASSVVTFVYSGTYWYISDSSAYAKLALFVDSDGVATISAEAKKISLTSGQLIITSGNFTLDASGNITASGATLTSADVTGKITTTSGDYKTVLDGGVIECWYSNKLRMVSGIYSSSYATQYCFLGAYGTDGIAFGIKTSSGGANTYIRINDENAEDKEGCRLHFIGISKFDNAVTFSNSTTFSSTATFCSSTTFSANTKHNSYIIFANDCGLAWGSTTSYNVGLRYATTSSGVSVNGLYLGITANFCPTYILSGGDTRISAGNSVYITPSDSIFLNPSDEIYLKSKTYFTANTYFQATAYFQSAHLNFDTNYGLEWGGNIGLRYYQTSSTSGLYVGITANSCETHIVGGSIYLEATAYTSSGTVVTSDARKKTNIMDLSDKYLSLIKSINPVSFQYTDGTSGRYHTGFTAQQVLEALNSADLDTASFAGYVDHDLAGTDLGLRYEEFIPLILMYCKDLENQIQSQQDKINELENQRKDD